MTRYCSKDSWRFLKSTSPASRLHVGTWTAGFLWLNLSIQGLTQLQRLQAGVGCTGCSILQRKQLRNLRRESTFARWKHLRRTGCDGTTKDIAGSCSSAAILPHGTQTERATQMLRYKLPRGRRTCGCASHMPLPSICQPQHDAHQLPHYAAIPKVMKLVRHWRCVLCCI